MLPITPVSAATILAGNNNHHHHPHYQNYHRQQQQQLENHNDKVERYLHYCRQLQQQQQQDESIDVDRSDSNESINGLCSNLKNIEKSLPPLSISSSSNGNKICQKSIQNNIVSHIDDDSGDNGTFLLDSWLENKLQTSFKQLNSILRNDCHHHHDECCEIFFLHHHNDDSQQELQQQQSQKINQTLVDNGGHDTGKIDSKPVNNDPLSNNSFTKWQKENLDKCIERLERIISNFNSVCVDDDDSSICCIILTRPNNELRSNDNDNNNLIYVYPPIESVNNDLHHQCDQSSSSSSSSSTWPKTLPMNKNSSSPNSRLTRLSGMFVTLFDVMIKLEQQQQQQRQQTTSHSMDNNILSISSLQLSGIDDYNQFNDIMSEYRISFIIENDNNNDDDDDDNEPIIMAIAMPINRFDLNNVRAMAQLIYDSMRILFGSIRATFSNNHHHYCHQNQQQHSNSIFDYLNKIFITMNTMLKLSSSSLSNNNCHNLTIDSLQLSGTFPMHNQSNDATLLPLQHLFINETTTMTISNVCKYLNDYDSLDWIDESIQFYKDGNDIEQALSEHFARCLVSIDDPNHLVGPNILPPLQQPSSSSSSLLLLDNNHIFDLLELELTFFTVIGSCLFYRGCLVKSHLPNYCLSIIHRYLYTRAIHALASHGHYHLVHFIRFHHPTIIDKQWKSSPSSNGKQTDLFLLILGHGHLIHCTIIQVYRFDRSADSMNIRFFDKYSGEQKTKSNPSSSIMEQNNDYQQQRQQLQLPSSFAFYVFIKESYRLLNFYLHRFAIDEQLEYSFKMTRYLNQSYLMNFFDKTFTSQINDNKWLNRLNPFNKLMNRLSKQDNNKNESFNTRFDTIMNRESEDNDEYIDKLTALRRSSRSGSHHSAYSMNPSIAESLLSNGSLYSQSTIHSITSTIASSSSSSSLLFDHQIHSPSSSINDKRSFWPCEHLPDTFICYLNIEHDFETFYGPILNSSDNDTGQQQQLWLINLMSELYLRINQLREHLQSMCNVEMKRRQRLRKSSPMMINAIGDDNQNDSHKMTTVKTAKTIIFHYDSNGQPIVAATKDGQQQQQQQQLNHHLQMRILIIGHCHMDYQSSEDHDQIIDEFYSCFRLKNQPTNAQQTS
nr:uncharacterized protein LOC124499397 [Dermatophagoides farinae]